MEKVIAKLELMKTEYEQGNVFETAEGHRYSVMTIIKGNEKYAHIGHTCFSQFDAINDALNSTLYKLSTNYQVADVSIAGANLPTSLQTFLKDKYESETQINSIKFE